MAALTGAMTAHLDGIARVYRSIWDNINEDTRLIQELQATDDGADVKEEEALANFEG